MSEIKSYVIMDKHGNLLEAIPLYPEYVETISSTIERWNIHAYVNDDKPLGFLIQDETQEQVYSLKVLEHIEVLGEL